MVVIQTTLDQRAMVTLARMERKTLRRGRNGPVRLLAWSIVVLEGFFTWVFLRGGQRDWYVNLLMGLIMLACILGEDRFNGWSALRRIPPEERVVNTTFQEEHYICRTQAGESWWIYSQVRAAVETKDYFALLLGRGKRQIFDKRGISWGDQDQFRALIRKQTGLEIQRVR